MEESNAPALKEDEPMSRTRYKIFGNDQPYFLTCTIVNWLPIFGNPEVTKIILNSLRFLQENKRLTIFAYVIMEHHLHLVASSENLSEEIGDFKSYSVREIIDYFKIQNNQYILKQLKLYKLPHKKDRKYQLWQEGNHPQQIQGDEMMNQKVEYIHNNPVKHGYVDEDIHWRYSSARNYAGLGGLLEVETEWF